ncbi:MAG TPA: sulfatase-like hydrolase/transferase, partial [Planctomycetaceae bacterium]|nr:sulfatase-like hydrolase/transferase [Planctomycetaceae bacterium]
MNSIRNSLLCVVFLLLSVSDSLAADKPNFVWLISEDNSKHYLKLFDDSGAETPNIAKLAAHGLIFERAFSNSPVCSVARTTLITSVYAPRLGTQYHRKIHTIPLPEGWKMFPAILNEAG